jgi:hypothetical protein
MKVCCWINYRKCRSIFDAAVVRDVYKVVSWIFFLMQRRNNFVVCYLMTLLHLTWLVMIASCEGVFNRSCLECQRTTRYTLTIAGESPEISTAPTPPVQVHRSRSFNPFRSYVEPRPTVWFLCFALMSEDVRHVAFVRPLSEPVRRFSSCSADFSQQIAQVALFLFLYVFLF